MINQILGNSNNIDYLVEQMSRVIKINYTLETGETQFQLVSPFLANLVINKSSKREGVYHHKAFAPNFYYEFSMDNKIMPQNDFGRMKPQSFFDFLYVLEGEVVENIDEKRNVYPSGSCRIVTQNTHYSISYETDFKALYISITNEFIQRIRSYEDFYLFSKESSICAPLLSSFLGLDLKRQKMNVRDYIVFSSTQNISTQIEEVLYLFHKIMELFSRKTEYGDTFILQGLFCNFLSLLTNNTKYQMHHIHLERSKDAILFSQITKILLNSDEKVSRSDLEKKLNYNGSHIGRIIRKYTGMSLYDYSMTFCMTKITQYIKSTDLPISEIIEKFGFSNKTHFYEKFKKAYNMTPNEYRCAVRRNKN